MERVSTRPKIKLLPRLISNFEDLVRVNSGDYPDEVREMQFRVLVQP